MGTIGLALSLLFSSYLVIRDCRRRRTVSWAIWIPTILVSILCSRSPSLWIAGRGSHMSAEMANDASTSAADQIFYFSVLAASFVIATIRRMNWAKLLTSNFALLLFYLYFALSVAWSSDPMGSSKRLFKDFGLLFVVALILTEKDPLEAMRAIYVRSAIVLLPLSFVFIKWYPNMGRSYGIGGEQMVTGVTTQKNSLGEIVLIFTLFFIWDYFESHPGGTKFRFKRLPWDLMILAFFALQLLHMSQSKTAMVCMMVGALLICRTGWLASRSISRLILVGGLAVPFVIFFAQRFASILGPLLQALGRNLTFTGRTSIWQHITLDTVDPMIGAGYWNFWGGPGGLKVNLAMNSIVPNAHNGYVDIYLDGGVIALSLLAILLLTAGIRITGKIRVGSPLNRYQRVRFAFLIAAIIYNGSESTFVRMGPIWFTTLLMMVEYPLPQYALKRRRHAKPQLQSGEAEQSLAMAHL
jgi:exopolysaccharide production protein ExoQ